MILTLSAIALATFVAANVARARRRRRVAQQNLPQLGVPTVPPKPKDEDLREAFVVGLGDVVLLRTGEEAWLSGVLVFDEGVQTLALFVGPDSGGSRYVLASRASSEAEANLVWLSEANDIVVSEGVHVIEHEGERLSRERRRPLAVKRTGSMAPEVGSSAVVSEYRGELGGAVVVVKGDRRTVVLAGRKLHPGTYDILPGTETS